MLGIGDGWVELAYVLCLASTALCIIYAWLNWNRGDDTPQPEDQRWITQEHEVDDNI